MMRARTGAALRQPASSSRLLRRHRLHLRAWCGLVLLHLVCAGPALADTPPPGPACPARPELMPAAEALPNLAAVLHPGGHLAILVIGSATVFGPEASLAPGTVTSRTMRVATESHGAPVAAGPNTPAGQAPGHPSGTSFPVRMKAALEARVPGLVVSLSVLGGRSLTAEDMVPMLRAGLAAPSPPQLVIWQTGTVDAVRNVPPGQFNQALSDGTDAVTDSHADLILVDPQFSRFLQANADLPPYFSALRNAAALPGVVLFPRFELMQSWSEAGGLDLENAEPQDALKSVEVLHACLGMLLAEMVFDDAGVP